MAVGRDELTSKQKAAQVIISLGADVASSIYKHLQEEEIEKLTYEITRQETVRPEHTDQALDEWAQAGFDWVWLLGVWQTGPAARRVSETNPEWLAEYRRVLPDFCPDDVCGSCFAVQEYHVHQAFGGDAVAAFLIQGGRHDVAAQLKASGCLHALLDCIIQRDACEAADVQALLAAHGVACETL